MSKTKLGIIGAVIVIGVAVFFAVNKGGPGPEKTGQETSGGNNMMAQGGPKSLKELLASNNFQGKIKFLQGRLNEGFLSKDEGIAFISHRELFNRYRLLRQPKSVAPSRARTTEAFWELQRGDFAVHTAHGIGRYQGLKRIYNSEFLALEYQDKSLIYVPITKIGLVSKYWAGERRAIRMDKLGAGNWRWRLGATKDAIKKLAQELLYIQALRMKHPGFAYPPDDDWQKEFESAFPYEETPDQTAIKRPRIRSPTAPKPRFCAKNPDRHIDRAARCRHPIRRCGNLVDVTPLPLHEPMWTCPHPKVL